MFGEYGYMEEGKLGRPYDLHLLKRLADYALPYKKTILTALLMTILTTLFDLAVPYFSKIAIDRYILSAWYRVDRTVLTESEARHLKKTYGHLLVPTGDGSVDYISHEGLRKIDPADLHAYRIREVLSQERFYRVRPDVQAGTSLGGSGGGIHRLEDRSLWVPYGQIEGLKGEDIHKIRAGDLQGVGRVALIFLGLIVLSFWLNYGEYYLLEFTGQHIMQDIRQRLLQRMQSQAVRFFDRHPVGRLVTRMTNDVENLNEMFRSVFVTVFKDFFLLMGILGVLLYLNWRLAMVCFTLIPIIFGLTLLFSRMAREAFRELRASVAKINAFLQERLTGMRVIQLFVREKFQMDVFSRINRENYRAGMKQIRVFAVFMPIMELFSSIAVALLIWHGGGDVIEEHLSLGALVAFIGYIQMFFKPIRDISEKYNIMQSAMASTERIFQFMDHREELPEPKDSVAPPAFRGHISFDQVTFGYDKDRPVLRNITFEVRPGETVAIVGATGSGKTTVVNLLERFYDPDGGVVRLDGIDLRNWDPVERHRQMGLCLQDVFIFAGNLADNIALGRPAMDARAIESAARMANALPFIQRFPDGFFEEMGEGGATLSTGQRQLLSFARALAGNPPVLILDEATSSIDPETERLVQGAISRMAALRTTLVVAHRLSTIRHADRILVMHRGEIVEQGTHEELMALRGIYYRLNRLREA